MQISRVFVSPQHELGSQQIFSVRYTPGISISCTHAGRQQTSRVTVFVTGGTQTRVHVAQCVQTRSTTVTISGASHGFTTTAATQGGGGHGGAHGRGAHGFGAHGAGHGLAQGFGHGSHFGLQRGADSHGLPHGGQQGLSPRITFM